MKLCIKCNIFEGRKGSNICKKCYAKEYHLRTYKNLIKSCAHCGEVSNIGRKKYCSNCKGKVPRICLDCKKEFFPHIALPRCPRCYYHWYKNERPEKFAACYAKIYKRIHDRRRTEKGLPLDHDFQKGPRGEGYLNKKGYRLFVLKDPITKKYRRIYGHALEMSKHLGRDLYPNERVHHKNGIRDDNRI